MTERPGKLGRFVDVGGSDHDGDVNINERRFRAIDLTARRDVCPDRVTVGGSQYVPFMLHVTFADDNTIVRTSLSVWRVRPDGRVDAEHDTTIAYNTVSWVESIAYADAPLPLTPGNYVRYPERDMVYPPVYSLSAHGVWFHADGMAEREELPNDLIAK